MKYLKVAIAGLLLVAVLASCQQNSSPKFNEEFVHSVYIWLKNPDSTEDRAAFEKSLKKFLKDSQYAETNYVGTPPKAVRDVVDDSFTYNLIVTFPSAEAQQQYQDEPAHKLFIQESSSLWSKVIVYDSQTIQ
ncbi:MAG: Dabb family protein [Bacteroidota bacterium]